MARSRRVGLATMRLVAQGLAGPPFADAAAAVRHLTCVQAQDLPGSTTSIALRTEDRTLAGVHRAYGDGSIVRSWPMRGTLHAVAAADLGWMLSLTAETMLRQSARRRQALGLTDDRLRRAEDVARESLAGAGLTRAGLLERWVAAGHDVSDGRGYHTLFHLAVRGVVCLGPMSDGDQLVVLAEPWIRHPRRLSRPEAIREWLWRYVTSHGPVTPREFLWWTKLAARDIAPALDDVRTRVAVLDVDGVEHWMSPDLPDRVADCGQAALKPLLLPGFDEMVLGYGDRRALLTREQEAAVVPGRNGVFRPTLVHRGRAVGTWSRAGRAGAPVTVTPFDPPLPATLERRLPGLTTRLPR